MFKKRKSPLVVKDQPDSPASEAYRILRTNMHFIDPDNPPKSIVITSPWYADGKSTVVSNLAISMANMGKRTILVDADLRKPVLHKFFDVHNKVGLTNLLLEEAGLEEVIRKTDVAGLSLISSGAIPPNPAELLHSKKMLDFIQKLRNSADMVLFDSPPLTPVTDAVILSSRVEGVLLVVDCRASRKLILHAKEILENGKINLLGAIVQKVPPSMGGFYHHYYCSQYRYGK